MNTTPHLLLFMQLASSPTIPHLFRNSAKLDKNVGNRARALADRDGEAVYLGCFHDSKEDRVLGDMINSSEMTTEVQGRSSSNVLTGLDGSRSPPRPPVLVKHLFSVAGKQEA